MVLILTNCFNCFPAESSISRISFFKKWIFLSTNLSHSEMCAVHYNTVHSALHLHHMHIDALCMKAFISNWSFTKKALVIIMIYRAMTLTCVLNWWADIFFSSNFNHCSFVCLILDDMFMQLMEAIKPWGIVRTLRNCGWPFKYELGFS